jgi:hypothetical protein
MSESETVSLLLLPVADRQAVLLVQGEALIPMRLYRCPGDASRCAWPPTLERSICREESRPLNTH